VAHGTATLVMTSSTEAAHVCMIRKHEDIGNSSVGYSIVPLGQPYTIARAEED